MGRSPLDGFSGPGLGTPPPFPPPKGMAPNGMVVIKRATNDPNKVYLMQKVTGYDPTHQDWYYAISTSADSSLGMNGRPSLCIDCHAKWAPTDYLGGPAIEAVRAKLK